MHNDMIGRYFGRLCTQEQRERCLPGHCSGELIAAIAMTGPGAGSDLQGIRTTAVRDGDHYVVNAQKMFEDTLAYAEQRTAFGQPMCCSGS